MQLPSRGDRLNKQQEMVREFHEAFGHPVSDMPTNLPEETATLRHVLMLEELQEYRDAAEAGDIVEVADALADLAYVLLGTAVSHGIDLEPVFEIIHSSNLSKLDENGNPVPHPTIPGKIGKSDLYWEPQEMIDNELEVQSDGRTYPEEF